MFEPSYPIASTDNVKHIFIDFGLNDYFESMSCDIEEQADKHYGDFHKIYHYDPSRTYSINDDGRFCIWIDKKDGSTEGWINFTGCCIPMNQMALVLKNNVRPLFQDQDEFLAFASYIEPSVRLSFKESNLNESVEDETILNSVLIQHVPVIIQSIEPFKYKLNVFYKTSDDSYDWNDKLDRIPVRIKDFNSMSNR